MDRGAWRATVHGVAELDTTERRTAATSLGCLSLSLVSLCPLGRVGDQFMNQQYVSYGEERKQSFPVFTEQESKVNRFTKYRVYFASVEMCSEVKGTKGRGLGQEGVFGRLSSVDTNQCMVMRCARV